MEHKVNEKRIQLIDLSKSLSALKKIGAIETVNEGLINIYTNPIHQYFKSYKQWQAEGLQVKKGEKAFLLWGCPKKINKKPQEQPQQENESKLNFYPIAFVFSNAQVEQKGDKSDD